MDRSGYRTRKARLGEADDERDIRLLTPDERVAMVWQLTLQAWAFTGELADEPGLRRDAVRVVRRGR